MSDAIGRGGQIHREAHEELAAGYALGALDEPDLRAFREHLPSCPRCQTMVGQYRAVANRLPDTLAEREASPGLKARVLATAEADVAARRPAAPTPLPARREPGARPGARRGLDLRWALPLAAMFLVTLGFGYWNLRLQEQLALQSVSLSRQAGIIRQQEAALELRQQALAAVATGARQWSLAGTERAPAAQGVLVQDPTGQPPILVVRGLPDLPPGQAYQAWVIAGGTPVEAGILAAGRGGEQVARLERPLGNSDTVALTIEPAAGSRAPTGPIVLAGRVQS